MALMDRYRGCKGLFNALADLLILAALVGSIFFLIRLPTKDGINYCYITDIITSSGDYTVNWCYDWATASQTAPEWWNSETIYWTVVGTIGAVIVGNFIRLGVTVTEECNANRVNSHKALLVLAYLIYFVPLGLAAGYMTDPAFVPTWKSVPRQRSAMILVLVVIFLHFLGGLWALRVADRTAMNLGGNMEMTSFLMGEFS